MERVRREGVNLVGPVELPRLSAHSVWGRQGAQRRATVRVTCGPHARAYLV